MKLRWKIARGMADALDRVGATVAALSLMGAWFTDQIPLSGGVWGILLGIGYILIAVYVKHGIDANEEQAT